MQHEAYRLRHTTVVLLTNVHVMPDILKVSSLHARSLNAFLHRLTSLNTASVANQRFYIKHLFLGYQYFDMLLRFRLNRVLRNTGWVEGRGYKTHGPAERWAAPCCFSARSQL
jgi:hypothetical protein